MPLWSKTGTKPQGYDRTQKRSIVATDLGWEKQIAYKDNENATRLKREVIADVTGLANSTNMGTPSIADIWFSASTAVANTAVDVFVSFDEPVAHNSGGGALKLNVANTVGGSAQVAVCATNTIITNAQNTLQFSFTPTVAGTYKIQAQTIANNTATAINLRSKNTGTEAASLVISGPVSNTGGLLVVTAS